MVKKGSKRVNFGVPGVKMQVRGFWGSKDQKPGISRVLKIDFGVIFGGFWVIFGVFGVFDHFGVIFWVFGGF